MFAQALDFLNRLSPAVVCIGLIGLTLIDGYFDYLVGTDATFSAIYLFPIAAAAWFLGRPAAYALAVISSLLWITGDIAAGARYSSVLVPMWNAAARFSVFVFALELIRQMRKLHVDLEKRATERAVKLTAEIATRERLEHELLQISEREQQRVGHDIHDSLCQHLTGTAFAAQVLAETLASDHSSAADNAFKLVRLVEESNLLARKLARSLSAVELENNGLSAALSDFASSTSDLFNISCRFECRDPFAMDDMNTAGHLYRIAQEAVGNSIKHGDAKNIVIELETLADEKFLRVTDDGAGLSVGHMNGGGMGLKIMAYRSELIGAKISIHRANRGGTVVTCSLPSMEALPYE